MYSEIAANKRKTLLLMVGFAGLVAVIGFVFSKIYGNPSLTLAVGIGGILYAIIQYFAADKLAVAVNGAKQIEKADNPRLWRIVENLSIAEGMPMPRVYIMNDPAPNAFASGRDPQHSLVCATTGLLDIMEDSELEGVFAHELGHIKNYDIRVSMIAFGLVSVVSILSDIFLRAMFWGNRDDDNSSSSGAFMIIGIIAAIIAPIAATMIQLAISRKREYLADATGALTTRHPDGLARALTKIGQAGSSLRRQNTSTAHLFFANPLKKRAFANLFSTHPPIEERVRRLQDMGRHE
ncbi:MAG: M48 family metalloprotease [Candidatus Saccharibacteria bacterium]|nr:M48 family metalloprotease [Candidatus Saccharibacteria bacterium]